MNAGKTLFAQLMDFLPWSTFNRYVTRYSGDKGIRTPSCAEQFRVMAFAQLTYRESLRDIEASLSAQAAKLYHMGLREPIRRSTLADANESRDWRIYADFAARLIIQARALYASEDLGLELSNTVYALDSTTHRSVSVGFSVGAISNDQGGGQDAHVARLARQHSQLYPCLRWQAARRACAGLAGAGTRCDLRHGSRLCRFRSPVSLASGRRFLCDSRQVKSQSPSGYSAQMDRCPGILCDQTIALDGFYSKQDYPAHLRRVRFNDPETGKPLVFLTNQMILPPETICALYKSRWQVELFFKWIKQHLRIKQFFGTSENAVKTQIWIAVSVYVLVAIVRKKLNLDVSLYTLLQVLSLTLFEKMTLQQAFPGDDYRSGAHPVCNQLNLLGI